MKKIVKYSFVAIICVAIILGIFIYFNSSESIPIKVGYKAQMAYLPLFVGLEKGYFENEGLVIEKVNFDSTNQMYSAMISGNLDASIGGANIPTLVSIEEKSPGKIKIFNTMQVNNNTQVSCVLVKNNSNITKISDLYGKKVASLAGTFSVLWIDSALNVFGLNKSVVEISGIAPELQLPALSSDQIDALFAIEPLCTLSVNKGTGKIIYSEPMKHFGSMLTSSVITSSLLIDNPRVASKLIKASDKSIDFIRQNPEEAKIILAKYTNTNVTLLNGIILPIYLKSSEINESQLQDLINKLFVGGEIKKQIVAKDLIFG